MTADIDVINFEILKRGMAGLTPEAGAFLVQAASVCLSFKHNSPTVLKVLGDRSISFKIDWEVVTDQQRRSHADLQEMTEHGACAVAIVLARYLTGKVVVSRARKRTGFDYWLGLERDTDGLFQSTARLEVSGILKGTAARVRERVKAKLKQIGASDNTGLSAHVAVVEFGEPLAFFVTKELR